jgi:hypothetical protein
VEEIGDNESLPYDSIALSTVSSKDERFGEE